MSKLHQFKIANYKHIFLDSSILINSHLDLTKLKEQKQIAIQAHNFNRAAEFENKIQLSLDCQELITQIINYKKANKAIYPKILVSVITISEILYLRDGTEVEKMWEDLKKSLQLREVVYSKNAAQEAKKAVHNNHGFNTKNTINCSICQQKQTQDNIKDDYKIFGSFTHYANEIKEATAMLTADSDFKSISNLFNIPVGCDCFLLEPINLNNTTNTNSPLEFERDMYQVISIT